ncbi:MAG: hypothetical protein Q8S31_09775, partial [Alphaproteobacteria bacterium]|nr:hypothetical protein [Alphaproteobacteria bacterium]
MNEELDFDHTNFLENIHLELDLNLNLNISTQNNEEHDDHLLNDELIYSDHDNFYDFFIDILNNDNDIDQQNNVNEYDSFEIDSVFSLTEKELNFCNTEYVDLINFGDQKHINKHIFEYLNFILPITFDSYLLVKKALFYLEQHAPYLWLDLKNFAEQFDSENIIDHMYFLNTLYLKILPQMALKERKDVEIVMGNLQGISPIAYALLVNISKYPQSINNNTEEVLKESYPTFYEHYLQSQFNEKSVQSKVKDRSVLGKRRPLNQEDQPVLKKKRILKEDAKNLKEEILIFIKDKSILEDLEDQENFIEELMITLNYTKYAGLRSMLIALYENEVLDQNIKDKLKKLSNAAKRMYNKKGIDNNYNKLDPQKVIEAVRIILSTSVIDTALDLENVVKKLKIDLNYENTYSAFRTVLVNVSQKEELSEEEKDILRRLSNAAVRIYNRQIIVNQLTSNQQKTLEVIRMVLSASITDTEADWENAVEKLKTDLEHKVTYKVTYAVLNMMFGRLSQKNGLSDGEKDKIRKLGDAIKRLCEKQKSQLNLLKNKPVSISMVEDVTPIRAVKKRNRKDSDIVLNKNGSKAQKKTSDKVLDKDVGSTLVNNNENAKNLKEEILNVIKDKVMSGDFKDQENFVQELMTTLNYTKCAGLRSIFVALYKEEAVNQNIKDKLKILSNAAERIYRKQRMANKLTSAQQKMLEVIRTFLLAPMTDAEIDWESLVEK